MLVADTEAQCGSCWLVEYIGDVEASYSASFLREVSLGIIKVGRTCNDAVRDFVSQLFCRVFLQLLQEYRRNFFWRESLLLVFVGNDDLWSTICSFYNFERPLFLVFLQSVIIKLSSDHSFRIVDHVLWVSRPDVDRGAANQDLLFLTLREANDRRRGFFTLVVNQNFRFLCSRVPDCHDRECCAKINSNGWIFGRFYHNTFI